MLCKKAKLTYIYFKIFNYKNRALLYMCVYICVHIYIGIQGNKVFYRT